MARQMGRSHLILPEENAREASVVEGLTISPVKELHQVVTALTGENEFPVYQDKNKPNSSAPNYKKDYLDIKGQLQARRATEIAVAGGHNLLLIGPPGSGKTMIAERIPSILPPMTLDESLGTTKIYSVVGKLNPEEPLIRERPFRAPHHSISNAGLVGGVRSHVPESKFCP